MDRLVKAVPGYAWHTFWYSLATWLLVFAAVTAYFNGPALESRFLPVNKSFKVTRAETQGTTLVLWGTVTVARQCKNLPPPTAKDTKGNSLDTYTGSGNTDKRWLRGETYKVGPWYIQDGVGKRLVLGQVHECHPLWDTVTRLGTIGPITAGDN